MKENQKNSTDTCFPRFFFIYKYCATPENNLQISNKSIVCIAHNIFIHTWRTTTCMFKWSITVIMNTIQNVHDKTSWNSRCMIWRCPRQITVCFMMDLQQGLIKTLKSGDASWKCIWRTCKAWIQIDSDVLTIISSKNVMEGKCI